MSSELLLAIDAGNSQTSACLFDGERVAATAREPTDAVAAAEGLVRGLTVGARVGATVVSTPGPALDDAYRRVIPHLLGHQPLVLSAGVAGPDRLADCAAAHELAGGACIAVDMGTATTVNAVDAEGRFLGGAIAAGLEVSMEALAARAARLGEVRLEAPARAIGEDTDTAMRSGAVFGHAGLVDGLVERFREELAADVPAIATGGLAGVVAPHCRTVSRIEPLLTLLGLRLLWIRAAGTP
ncbi:MAG: type III pantothenate kinase [Gaiellales bacterium]